MIQPEQINCGGPALSARLYCITETFTAEPWKRREFAATGPHRAHLTGLVEGDWPKPRRRVIRRRPETVNPPFSMAA